MRTDGETMTADELVDGGVIQELNRRLLNPAGLRAVMDPDTGAVWISRVSPDFTLPESAQRVPRALAFEGAEMWAAQERVRKLGVLRQQFAGMGPERVAVGGVYADDDLLARLSDACRCAADAVPGLRGVSEDAAFGIAIAVRETLRTLCVESTDGGATWWARSLGPASSVPDGVGRAVLRAMFLVDDIARLQAADGGGELYPHEVEQFERLRGVVAEVLADSPALADDTRGPEASAALLDAVADLETLYASAQRGMRIARGDPDALRSWEAVRPKLQAAAQAAFDGMDAYEKLIAGQLYDWEEADWPTLERRIADRLSAAVEAQADADRTAREAAQEIERCVRARDVVLLAMARLRDTGGAP